MWQKVWQNKLVIATCLGVIVRAYLITLPSHPYDIGTYQAWGSLMLAKGPLNFFTTTWSDYLAFPIFAMSAVSWISSKLTISFGLLFKLVVVALELGLIWRLSRATSVLLLLLSPALVLDSALWGQLDTIPALLALLSLLTTNRRFLSGVYFGLSLAFKPIFILVSPVLLISSRSKHTTSSNLLSTLIVFIATSLPVYPSVKVFTFLFAKIFEQASTYPFRTINAFNFWNLGNPLNLWPSDNVSYLGVSAHTLGLIIFLLFTLVTFRSWAKHLFNNIYAPRVAATILILFFTFTTRMHERHLLFGIVFLAIALLRDKRLLPAFVALSASLCLNLWGAYYWVLHDQSWPFSFFVSQLVSWVTVLSSLSLLVWDWQGLFTMVKSWLRSNKVFMAIIIISLTLRVVGLAHPKDYIFDEVYHAFTAREFLHNNVEAWEWWTTPPPSVAYEWTHPPLAKYGMGLGMLIFGENSFGWRLGSALFGTAVVIASYQLTYILFNRRRLSLIAAFLVAVDGLNLSQSRIAMNDIYMLAFMLFSLVETLRGRWRRAGLLYGLSLASKWSALYGLLPLALIYFHSLSQLKKRTFSYYLVPLRSLAISILVYLASYIPFLVAGHTWGELLELHRQMWYYHTHLVATHAYESLPWQWLFDLRPVWYFVEYGNLPANIYALDNPLTLWLGLSALVLLARHFRRFPNLFLLAGYTSFVLPWIFSPRIMFFYHYLPSVTFLCFALAVWIDSLGTVVRYAILALCTLSFLVISPLLFGIHMPASYTNALFLLFPSWK